MSDLIYRLRERAGVARSEKTGTGLGDAVHFEEAAERIEALEAALADALSGLRYVRANYPEVSGVGFDRCQSYQSLIGASTI